MLTNPITSFDTKLLYQFGKQDYLCTLNLLGWGIVAVILITLVVIYREKRD